MGRWDGRRRRGVCKHHAAGRHIVPGRPHWHCHAVLVETHSRGTGRHEPGAQQRRGEERALPVGWLRPVRCAWGAADNAGCLSGAAAKHRARWARRACVQHVACRKRAGQRPGAPGAPPRPTAQLQHRWVWAQARLARVGYARPCAAVGHAVAAGVSGAGPCVCGRPLCTSSYPLSPAAPPAAGTHQPDWVAAEDEMICVFLGRACVSARVWMNG